MKIAAEPPRAMPQPYQNNRLFRGVSVEEMNRVAPLIHEITFGHGQVIFAEREQGDAFYLVRQGLVRISKSGRGGEQETITYVEPEDFFGEMALLDASPRSARATAVEATTLGCIDRERFQQLLAIGCPQLQMNFLLQVVERLRGVSEHFIAEVMRAERLSLVGSMAAAIIHDLNNPLSAILGCSDLLAAENSATQRAKMVKLNKNAINQILAMIHELLDFSRGRVVELQAHPEKVSRILEDLDAQVFRLLPSRKIELVREIGDAGEVTVDRGRFVRVLANLVKNAMEAMPEGGRLTLNIQREPEAISFAITDTGGGIPPEIQKRIFEPFVTAGKKQGTGLGMAIAKSVVEAHRGEISVQSQLGSGTTVTVRIPASPGAF